MIHVKTPFSVEKNLGKAYNTAFKDVGDDDWICLIDRDVMFLTPNSIPIMYDYTKMYDDTGIFTAYTNRIHPLAVDQLLYGYPSENDSVSEWETIAIDQEKKPMTVTEINHPISGFLMLIAKRTWNEIKFMEDRVCLGVDNFYSQSVLNAGKKIYRMDKLVVWHTYRLKNIRDKSHLI